MLVLLLFFSVGQTCFTVGTLRGSFFVAEKTERFPKINTSKNISLKFNKGIDKQIEKWYNSNTLVN